jgi:hypothetical protein
MPKFLDVHPLKGVDEETLRKAQKTPNLDVVDSN